MKVSEIRAMPAGTGQSSLLVSADRRNPQKTKPPVNQRAEGNQLPPSYKNSGNTNNLKGSRDERNGEEAWKR